MAKHTLDNSLDMIFWLNFDGSFKYFNDAFVEKTGYSKNEIQQMKAFDFLQNGNIENFQKDWQKLQNGIVMEGLDRNLKTKSGAIMPCELTVTMVKFEGYEFSSNVLRNISERRKKEQQITQHLEEIERLNQITQDENVQLKEAFELEYNFSKIISRDPNYKKILRQVEQVADTEATVLILGETGTGKELLARAIHQLSSRYDKPLIKINCAALPENLIESELFGHEKGAFTGAYQQKIGKFERAHKATVFLDEIGELPLDLQTKLLRVLQEGEIERVGGTTLIQIDARVIAATNRNLEKLVAEGKFREDLFYRLNVFPIHNIPLRERREDIPILVNHFAEKYSKKINKPIKEISQAGLNKLMAYDFLGNVRELENLIERAVILAKSDVLTFDFPLSSKRIKGSSRFKTMEELQRTHIINALKRANGKVSGKAGAAELLGMNDKTLASRMKKLDINKFDYLKK
jgi:PAS domain S-box-containing protein